MNQRWLFKRTSFRPAGETINPRRFEVSALGETDAKTFVREHHYSGSYPAARFRFGLYTGGELSGVAVFSVPMRDSILTTTFGGAAKDSVELGRFVLLDHVPGNGESWFLARCFEQLRTIGIGGVISFSDPMPRSTSTGETIFAGHLGTIYQAHNARYLGRGDRRTLRLLPDGRVFSARAISKVRAQERGWEHCAQVLEAAGAPQLELGGDHKQWLASALGAVTRPVRHPGNHKYAWVLRRRGRMIANPESYPKGV